MKRQLTWVISSILVVVAIFFQYFHKWEDTVSGGGDSWGYYSYLPSAIIHGDLKDLSKVIEVRKVRYPGTVHLDRNGKNRISEASNVEHGRVMKYTYGLSLFYIPGFIISHLYALIHPGVDANGYTLPYIFMLYLSSVIYVILGLILIWKLIHSYFDDITATITILILGLGTNLFYFMVWNNVMAHPILFFLWSVLIYHSNLYWKKKIRGHFLIAVTACAAISIIRPSEIICYLIIVFWGSGKLLDRIKIFLSDKILILSTFSIGLLFLIPQLLYWKYTSGQWIFDSYPDEQFQFSDPHVWQGLIGFMNGWLPYSPLMILSVVGMVMMLRSTINTKWLISIIFVIHVYIIYSWWNWYYINGFGSRPMVDIYPLLAIPMAYLISNVTSRILQWTGGVLVFLLISLNIFQTYQHDKGILWPELGNLGYYMQTFGQTSFSKKISVALDMNEFQGRGYRTLDTIYHQSFEDEQFIFRSDSIFRTGDFGYHITTGASEDFKMVEIPYESIFNKDHDSISHFYLEMDVYVEEQITSFYEFEILILEYVKENGTVYKRRYLRLNNKPGEDEEISIWWGTPRTWDKVEVGFRISSRFKDGHKFRMFFKKGNKKSQVFVDNLTLYSATK